MIVPVRPAHHIHEHSRVQCDPIYSRSWDSAAAGAGHYPIHGPYVLGNCHEQLYRYRSGTSGGGVRYTQCRQSHLPPKRHDLAFGSAGVREPVFGWSGGTVSSFTGDCNGCDFAMGRFVEGGSVPTVPEPSSLLLLGRGLIAFDMWHMKRKKDAATSPHAE